MKIALLENDSTAPPCSPRLAMAKANLRQNLLEHHQAHTIQVSKP